LEPKLTREVSHYFLPTAVCVLHEFCPVENYRLRIPYLSRPDWDVPTDIEKLHKVNFYSDADDLLEFAKPSTINYPVDEKLINERIAWGLDLWNADSLFLENISYKNQHPVFHVTTCDYFAAATSMFILENETVKAVIKKRYTNCPVRQKYYLRTEGLDNNTFKPITLGCLVVFALKFADGYRILIQKRSAKNATSNMVTSICPTFGLSPFIGRAPQNASLLYYNFLREYLEELHYVKEASKLKKESEIFGGPKSYYDYLYDLEPARQLRESSQFNLYYIGFGFNLTNGAPNLGLLAKVDDTALSQDIFDSIFINWEVDNIREIKVNAGDLENLFKSDLMDPASSYFLERALRYLE